MRITDRLIKNKEFYHHMKESLEDINYIFKNGRDELKVRVDKRTGNVTDYSLNNNPNCELTGWARDIVVDSIAFPFKSNGIRTILKL